MSDASVPSVATGSTSSARTLALGATMLTGGLTVAAQWSAGEPVSARVPAATFAGAVALTALAGPAPRVASGFAVVLLVAGLLVTGPQVWSRLSSRLASDGASPTAPDRNRAPPDNPT